MKKGININKNLYHNDSNFYWMRETPKMLFIEWIPELNCDGSELDQNINYKELIVKKDNSGKHCLKDYTEGNKEFLIYPFQAGTPFYLEPATIEHLEAEIKNCEKFGVSGQYYKNLRIFFW